MMKVLVGCEHSGIVRDAFLARGHDAVSCDLLPTEAPGPHIQGDILNAITVRKWDLAIFHPPCTYLCNSGVRWLYDDPERWVKMINAAMFFRQLLNAPIPHIAIENPIMHGHAIDLIGERPSQFIQPWMFGHKEKKATGLWLKGLPPLTPTDEVLEWNDTIHMTSPGPDRWKVRSQTFTGIAEAMATQWGGM